MQHKAGREEELYITKSVTVKIYVADGLRVGRVGGGNVRIVLSLMDLVIYSFSR